MPSFPISFAQAFALNKGANYSNLKVFKGIPINVTLSNIQLEAIPGATHYVPDIHSNNLLSYTLANTSNTFNNNLVFKHGGDIASVDSQTLTSIITSKLTTSFQLQISYGDFVFVNFAAGSYVSSKIAMDGKAITLETGISTSPSVTSRGLLVGNNNDTQATFGGAVPGFILGSPTPITKIYWSGYVNPKETGSEYYDFRIIVGFTRDHTGALAGTILFHPQAGGTQQRLSLDGLIGYKVFVDVNDNKPKWWIMVAWKDFDQVLSIAHAIPTNAVATDFNRLQVEINGSNYVFTVNGVVLASIPTLNPALFDLESLLIYPAVLIRAIKNVQSGFTLPNDKPLKITTSEFVWIREDAAIAAEGNPSISETGLHNTGLCLLKKLK